MKRTDVIVHSSQNSKTLRDLMKSFFPDNIFLIYDINKKQLFNKCWLNSCSYLVIEVFNQHIKEDDNIINIIRDIVYNKRRIMIFSKETDFDYLKLNEIIFETMNDEIIFGKIGNYIPLIIIKSFDSLIPNTKMILDSWNIFPIDVNINNHSDIYILAKYKKKCSEFLHLLKKSNFMDKGSFNYSDFHFLINVPKIESESPSPIKLLTFINMNDSIRDEIFSFHCDDYFSALHTVTFGQIILYSECLGSSFDLMDRFLSFTHSDMELIIISKIQTQGKGRGSNKWISPLGCAMFTCSLTITMSSFLGNSMCLIQHILAVSIVESLCSEFKIKVDLLKIKWPNDIYWVDRGKISGIISKASSFSQKFLCILGCGINVSNNDPTVCIYDLIRESNVYDGKYPSIETVIACVMNYFEMNISAIQSDPNGIRKFKEKYYTYWMHQNQKVTIKNETTCISGRINGINDYGYLEMIPDSLQNNESPIMLHPDGNSFDMMHNLIIPKK